MTRQLRIADIHPAVWKAVADEIAKYSTGVFLNKQLIGSATFISWDGKFGLLTAKHVIDNPDSAKLTLDFTGRREQILQLVIAEYLHVLALPVRYLSSIDLGARKSDEFGPDLAVVVLPPGPQLNEIRAKKSFWPLDINTNTKRDRALVNQGMVAICGNPAEKVKDPKPVGQFPDAQEARGFAGFTFQSDYNEQDGFDYVEVKSIRTSVSGALKSYGGMSGGGMWRVPIYQSAESDDDTLETGLYLLGTVFWQGPEIDGHRTLRGHGPKTIYDLALKMLRMAD